MKKLAIITCNYNIKINQTLNNLFKDNIFEFILFTPPFLKKSYLILDYKSDLRVKFIKRNL